MASLTPQKGVRVLLDLAPPRADLVVYRVELHAPHGSWATEACIGAAGPIDLAPWQSISASTESPQEPEAWMIDGARAFLRTLHKNHAASGDWPVRILRWRDRRP